MAFWNISFNRSSKEEMRKRKERKGEEDKTERKVRRVRKVATQLLGRVGEGEAWA